MKKLLLCLMFVCLIFTLTGCQKSTSRLVEDNMSEITYDYYFAENSNFSVSISVGKRENPYLIDGIHHANVDFSLITFKDKTFSIKDRTIDCQIVIDGKPLDITLEYNPIGNAFMADLGFKIKTNENVDFVYNDTSLNIPLASQDFGISSSEALDISCQRFEELIKKYTTKNTLQGECYLKILGLRGDDNNIFWCFTFVGRDNKSYNLIINIASGSILASDF